MFVFVFNGGCLKWINIAFVWSDIWREVVIIKAVLLLDTFQSSSLFSKRKKGEKNHKTNKIEPTVVVAVKST